MVVPMLLMKNMYFVGAKMVLRYTCNETLSVLYSNCVTNYGAVMVSTGLCLICAAVEL